MTNISIDIMSDASFEAGVRKLEDWVKFTLEPACDAYARALAVEAKKIMERDAHGPEDDPAHNDGMLKHQIKTAPYTPGMVAGEGSLTIEPTTYYSPIVEGMRTTNPSKEMYETRPKGCVPVFPPHDFTRNVRTEIGERAQEIWNMTNGGHL